MTLQSVSRRENDIGDSPVDQQSNQMIMPFSRRQVGITALRTFVQPRYDGDLKQFVDFQVTGKESVIDIVRIVGDLIGKVDQLTFQRRTMLGIEVAEYGHVVVGLVLDDAFADFVGKIQPAKLRIAIFDIVDHAQRLRVVIESAVVFENGAQGILAGMAEGRMAQIVDEGNGFGEVFVEAESTGDRTRDLCDFHSVRQARAEVVVIGRGEYLRLVFEAAKRCRMDHAVAVALEAAAVFVFRLGELPPAGTAT